jgi:hypothetical protein
MKKDLIVILSGKSEEEIEELLLENLCPGDMIKGYAKMEGINCDLSNNGEGCFECWERFFKRLKEDKSE